MESRLQPDRHSSPPRHAPDFRVFVCTPEGSRRPAPPAQFTARMWAPSLHNLVPPGMGLTSLQWWIGHHLHLLGSQDYHVLFVMDGVRPIHRSAAIPACIRWPFMAAQDIHICRTWTHPEYRGQGLATFALASLLRDLALPGRKFWYLVRPSNAASIAVCTKAGFVPYGYARAHRHMRFLPQCITLDAPCETPKSASEKDR